jgi:Ras-related protein Rab-7A
MNNKIIYIITQMRKHLYKVLILGDSNVGKTSLMNAYILRRFTQHYKATIGADFMTKDICIRDNIITLQIWDTSGQERYNSLGMPFYRGAECCIFIYDVTKASSLENVHKWYEQLESCMDQNHFDNMAKILVGSKIDLDRVVTKERGECYARRYGMPYTEISSKDMNNIQEPFENVTNQCFKRYKEASTIAETVGTITYVKVGHEDERIKSKCC